MMEEKFDEEIKLDREKVKEMALQRFHKWLKVFRKVESERIALGSCNILERKLCTKERKDIFNITTGKGEG